MDERTGKRDADGSFIWLRHTMQVNSGKRVHTLHVEIPVPLGASAEVRERLIREAEAGMEQLADHIEGQAMPARMPQSQTQSQPSQSVIPPVRPANSTTPAPSTSRPSMPASAAAANGTTARESNQSPAAASPEAVSQETVLPPSRPTIGASMPSAPSESGGSLTLPQFLQFLKELGVDARQAMDYLKVKTLSGLNYREALDQIQQIILREQANQAPAGQKPRDSGSSGNASIGSMSAAQPERKAPPSPSAAQSGTNKAARAIPNSPNIPNVSRSPAPPEPPKPSSQAQVNTTTSVPPGVIEIKHAVVREVPRAYFDEEVNFEDEGEGEGEGPDLLDAGDDGDFISELTDLERETAHEILAKLQDAHGSSNASEARLRVLRTVVNNQVPDDRLEELVQGIWGITSLRKLKDEQLEALISWAKNADDFIAEVDIVLTLLQEEEYAGSDR
jgi:hypothetical protein